MEDYFNLKQDSCIFEQLQQLSEFVYFRQVSKTQCHNDQTEHNFTPNSYLGFKY